MQNTNSNTSDNFLGFICYGMALLLIDKSDPSIFAFIFAFLSMIIGTIKLKRFWNDIYNFLYGLYIFLSSLLSDLFNRK